MIHQMEDRLTMVAQNRMEKRQKREELILDGAGELIADVGFFELKMSDLARTCGISVGTLYGHFASKEDLLIGLAVMAGASAPGNLTLRAIMMAVRLKNTSSPICWI